MTLLERIKKPNDIKKIPQDSYEELAAEIRQFLVEKVSETGGHLASNLGAVELTMALHLSLNLPEDKIVWDVGHQSYTHKLLTGRRKEFDHLRQYGGMSGFPKRKESPCDTFDTGHSSTSISAALGMVRARELRAEHRTIVAVIGDGAMTGGLAYEALNNVSHLSSNLIIILNDNSMSISRNVGGMPRYLSDIRTSNGYIQLRDKIYDSLNDALPIVAKSISKAKQSLKTLMVPGMFFEDMDITYLGPVDGHNVRDMVKAIGYAKRVNKAVLIHVCTKKGIGYAPAEKNPSKFHGTPPFDIATGQPKKPGKKPSYTDTFSSAMLRLASEEAGLVGITAAMEDGVGLQRFHTRYPNRFFDVGIAEQHAVTFAAGLAAGGMKPVVAVYSTFLQRAYDQIVTDVCLQKLPVVFAIDRAGIVGADGETHLRSFLYVFDSGNDGHGSQKQAGTGGNASVCHRSGEPCFHPLPPRSRLRRAAFQLCPYRAGPGRDHLRRGRHSAAGSGQYGEDCGKSPGASGGQGDRMFHRQCPLCKTSGHKTAPQGGGILLYDRDHGGKHPQRRLRRACGFLV